MTLATQSNLIARLSSQTRLPYRVSLYLACIPTAVRITTLTCAHVPVKPANSRPRQSWKMSRRTYQLAVHGHHWRADSDCPNEGKWKAVQNRRRRLASASSMNIDNGRDVAPSAISPPKRSGLNSDAALLGIGSALCQM
jgi:hypothetical protein